MGKGDGGCSLDVLPKALAKQDEGSFDELRTGLHQLKGMRGVEMPMLAGGELDIQFSKVSPFGTPGEDQ